jgi:hypothetical protein
VAPVTSLLVVRRLLVLGSVLRLRRLGSHDSLLAKPDRAGSSPWGTVIGAGHSRCGGGVQPPGERTKPGSEGTRPAPPGFGCRCRPSAGWCEGRNPARTTTPSHVPMMPLHRRRRCHARRLRAGPLAVKPLLTCALRCQRCRRLSSIVDLGRPEDGLADSDRPARV